MTGGCLFCLQLNKGRMCDLGVVIKDHMRMLMRMFQQDLQAEYGNMLQDGGDTKCLNTAVTLMFALLGRMAVKHTRYCDVSSVQARVRKEGRDDSTNQVSLLKKDLLHSNHNSSLFYIMITNADLPSVDDANRHTAFPGHVFVIHKDATSRVFRLYQSYINEYNLAGAIQMNRNVSTVPPTDIHRLIDGLQYMFSRGVWDEHVRLFWKALTFVDTPLLLNHIITGHILFCFRRVDMAHCTTTLRKLLVKRMQNAGWDQRKEAQDLLTKLDALDKDI